MRTPDIYVATDAIPNANHLKVSVFYDLGGINYSNYKTEPRGYWVSVTPVELSQSNGFDCERITGMVTNPRIFKVFIGGATRLSKKTLAVLAAKVAPVAPALVAPLALETPDRDAVVQLVLAAVAA